MNFLNKLLAKVDGYKTILGYLILQFAGSYPMLLGAFTAWMADKGNQQAVENLVGQLVLAGGVFHRFIKNINKYRKGEVVA